MTNIEQIVLKELLYDIKQKNKKLSDFSDAVERMLKRYEIEDGDYENSEFAKEKYKKLGWENCEAYDIAIPLWSTLTCALAECSSREDDEIKNRDKTLYILDENDIIKYYVFNRQEKNYVYEFLAKKHLEKNTLSRATFIIQHLIRSFRVIR